MQAITGLLNLISILISIGTSVWVYFDARKIGIKKISRENPGGKSVMNMGPLGWAICCFLFWIVIFPIYLIKRRRLKKFQVSSASMSVQPPMQWEELKTTEIPLNPKPKRSKFKLGCLGLLVIFVLIIIGAIIPGEQVTIQGATGHMEHTVLADTMSGAEDDVASAVYDAATAHPELKQLTLTLDLGVPGGFVDKYGKEVPGPYVMGDITVTNLDEVRKYTGWTEYLRQYQIDYYVQIQGLKYSDQLTDK